MAISIYVKEEFEDTKGEIRIHIPNRQHNGQKKKSTKGQTTINKAYKTYTYCDIRYTGILDLYQGTTKLIDEIPVETLLVKRNTMFFRFTFL
jgi:hypothetical protein